MDISANLKFPLADTFTYRNWTLDMLHVAFFNQDFFRPVAETLDVCVLNVVAFLEVLNPSVEIVS